MQKIIEQRLVGSLEVAESKAQYTWQKDEIAYICETSNDLNVIKVQFTGNRVLRGNKWGYYKYYECNYLKCLNKKSYRNLSFISDTFHYIEEERFYTTKESAIQILFEINQNRHQRAVKEYLENIDLLISFKQNQFKNLLK